MALNFQDRDIEDKFKKLSFTEAQCKSCSNTFTHTYIDEFRTHVETHKEIVEKEKSLPSTPSAKYIRYNQEESRYQCVLCKKNVEIESEHCSTQHIHEENEYALMRTFYEEWQLKYCETQQEEDSEIKCYICQTKISIDFRKDYLMYHIREYHTEHSPQNVKDITALNLSQDVLQNFDNFSQIKAECKTCNKILTHSDITKFLDHIETHKDVVDFEEQSIPSPKYIKFIKYCENKEMQCVLCEAKITNDYKNHIHANDEFTSMGTHYDQWKLKYCKRISRSKIKCNFCSQSIKVQYYPSKFTYHRQTCKSKSMNKLSKNYKILSQYYNTVQCKYCNAKYSYNSINNIKLHLTWEHPHINTFQNQNPDISCRNLKYLNKKHFVCNLCYELVPLATLLDHECKDDYKDTKAVGENWLWKYFIQKNNFAKCAVCNERFAYEFNKYQLEYEHVQTCATKRQEIWKYFKQDDEKSLSNVRCTLCTQSEEFIKYADTDMSNHIRSYHGEIFEFETGDEQSLELRKYIMKYEDDDYLPYRCIFCKMDLALEEEFKDHKHEDKKTLHHLYYDEWPWKYCTKLHGSVKCDICTEKIEIEYDSSLLENHLETYHPSREKYLKRTYEDIAGPIAGTSGILPKKQKK